MCLWGTAALTSALSSVGWSVGELAGQYMVAIGMVKPLHTLIEYYTHIKGIEYLLCVAFFVAFPPIEPRLDRRSFWDIVRGNCGNNS